MFFKFVAALTVLAVLGVGYYVSQKGSDAISSLGDRLRGQTPATGTDSKDKVCSTLSASERVDILGRPTPYEIKNVEGALDPYTCRWAIQSARNAPYLEVIAAPADAWAKDLRSHLSDGAVRPSIRPQVAKLLAAGTITPAVGCRVARMIFEADGAPHGVVRTVTKAPGTAQGSGALLAQSCVHDTYYGIFLLNPGRPLDGPYRLKLTGYLHKVEQRLTAA